MAHRLKEFIQKPSPMACFTTLQIYITILVENARKFWESALNQILIFGEPPPRAGVSENVWVLKFKHVYRAGGASN